MPGREAVSALAWRVRPQDNIRVEALRVVHGRCVMTACGSKRRMIALLRVRVPDAAGDSRMDYSAALRTAVQQQRMKGLFEGLRRASVPFIYTVMMSQAEGGEQNAEQLEFDLVVGTWADGREKDLEVIEETLEQRTGILSAALSVALPDASVGRLERGELGGFIKSFLLPGEKARPMRVSAEIGTSLCTFEETSPAVGSFDFPPDFYIPNSAESGKGGIILGTVASGGGKYHEFTLQLEDLRRHVAILGMTGSGKSTTCATIVKQAAEAGSPVLVLDWHNEYGQIVSSVGGRIFSPGKDGFSLNPVEVAEGTDPVEHIAMVSDIFSDIYHFTHPQAYMFRNALQKRMSETSADEAPTLVDLVKTIEAHPLRSAYDNETKVALLRRLVPLTQGQAGRALVGAGRVNLEDILGNAVCLELGYLRDVQTRAVFANVVLKMVYEARVRDRSGMEHLTVVEEARNVAPARRAEDPPSVGERMVSELRKFGEALMFVAQFPSQVAAEVVKNSGTKIVHRVDWPEDVSIIGESLGLDERQREHLAKLRPGEAIVSVERIRSPLLVQVRPTSGTVQERSELNLSADP